MVAESMHPSNKTTIVESLEFQEVAGSATIKYPAGLTAEQQLALLGAPVKQAFGCLLNGLAPDCSPLSMDTLTLSLSRLCAHFLHAHEEACIRGQPLLTSAGVSYFESLVGRVPVVSVTQDAFSIQELARTSKPLPFWDCKSRRLRLGPVLVKQFRQPSPNQIAILEVFEEEGWKNSHIDDPLPRGLDESDDDAKRRLHDTIHNLNRGLRPATIQFRGDGTGQGVLWTYHDKYRGTDRTETT